MEILHVNSIRLNFTLQMYLSSAKLLSTMSRKLNNQNFMNIIVNFDGRFNVIIALYIDVWRWN